MYKATTGAKKLIKSLARHVQREDLSGAFSPTLSYPRLKFFSAIPTILMSPSQICNAFLSKIIAFSALSKSSITSTMQISLAPHQNFLAPHQRQKKWRHTNYSARPCLRLANDLSCPLLTFFIDTSHGLRDMQSIFIIYFRYC